MLTCFPLAKSFADLFFLSRLRLIRDIGQVRLALGRWREQSENGQNREGHIVEPQASKIKIRRQPEARLPRTNAKAKRAKLTESKYVSLLALCHHLSSSFNRWLCALCCNLTTSVSYCLIMIISNIINESFGLLSKQLRFYCWHFRKSLDQRQRQELIDLLYEQHFERLANKIKSIYQTTAVDCKQQVGKLLFEHCLSRNKRHQLIQLIESDLVDVNVRLDNYGRTLLHRSAYNLDVDLVKILIKYGVNIRLRDYAGNTALHIAIQSYRNGAVIYGNGTDVVKNLTSIIELLLNADKDLRERRYSRKKIKLLGNQGQHDYIAPLIIRNDSSRITTKFDHTRVVAFDSTTNMSTLVSTRKSNTDNLNRSIGEQVKEYPYISQAHQRPESVDTSSALLLYETRELDRKQKNSCDNTLNTIDPILLEDISSPLIDTKNAFGRTALHYCVLVVGEQHLSHFVKLLISYGADADIVDTRMKTPLYCLVKRPGISAIREKCTAITHLLESGCDDLGLAIQPRTYFSNTFVENIERNISSVMQVKLDTSIEPIFCRNSFKRIPSLKHITRLYLIRMHDEKLKLKRQTRQTLPEFSPISLSFYINRRILDQSEFF